MDVLGDELQSFVDAWAEHERRGHELAMEARRLELAGAWAESGAVSMAAWIRHHCRTSMATARATLRHGRFLTEFAAIADAALSSMLSSDQVGALRRNVSVELEPLLAEHEADLVETLAPLSVRDTETACRVWRSYAESVIDASAPGEPVRHLTYARGSDGATVGSFTLDVDGAAQFTQAIETAKTFEAGDPRSNRRRNGDALVDVCAFFNAHHASAGTPRHRPHVDVIVELAEWHDASLTASLVDGPSLTAAGTDTLLCDAVLHRVIRAGSAVLDVGRSTRTVPATMFRALVHRDGGCRFPGCDRPVAWTDAHHIRHWRHGGDTSVANLVLLCTGHHHIVHSPGWQLKLLPDSSVEVTNPNGKSTNSCPRPVRTRLPTRQRC
jgi:hypothetical protein